jgi:hypothetical protein
MVTVFIHTLHTEQIYMHNLLVFKIFTDAKGGEREGKSMRSNLGHHYYIPTTLSAQV